MDPNLLSILPGYSHLFSEKKTTALVSCQFTFCIAVTLVFVCFAFMHVVHAREKLFRRALRLTASIREKIADMETRRQWMTTHLEKTEGKCNMNYALLDCLSRNKEVREQDGQESNANLTIAKDLGKSTASLGSNLTYANVTEADGKGE